VCVCVCVCECVCVCARALGMRVSGREAVWACVHARVTRASGKRTTAGVVHNLLDDTLDVALALSEVELAELGRPTAVLGMRLQAVGDAANNGDMVCVTNVQPR
jgi:hypothetical protein